MKIKSKQMAKFTVCLLLAVTVFACSFSIYAVDPTPTPEVTPYPGTGDNPLMRANDQTMAFLIWQLLQSWGIDVQYSSISGYTEEVQQEITNWVWEFLDEQPSIETIYAWILDWWFGTDFWGNLVVNDTLLEDVTAFADWLVDKFDLQDNGVEIVEPVFKIGGYTLYEIGTIYHAHWTDMSSYGDYVAIQGRDLGSSITGYFCCGIQDANYPDGYHYYYVFASYQAGRVDYTMYAYRSDDTDFQYLYGGSAVSQNTKGLYLSDYRLSGAMFNSQHGNFIPYGDNFKGTLSEFQQFISTAEIMAYGDNRIVTGDIVLPPDDPTYGEGQGMSIIDGEPVYQEVTIPDNITVDNLPAVISPNTSENPEIDQIYTNIPALVETAASSMSAFKQIIFMMPDEVLICIYAVLSAGVIFGFLRIMREH